MIFGEHDLDLQIKDERAARSRSFFWDGFFEKTAARVDISNVF